MRNPKKLSLLTRFLLHFAFEKLYLACEICLLVMLLFGKKKISFLSCLIFLIYFSNYIIDGFTQYIAHVLRQHNLWLYDIYAPLQFFTIIYFYYLVLKNKTLKKNLIVALLLFTFLSILIYFFVTELYQVQYISLLGSAMVTPLAYLYMHQCAEDLELKIKTDLPFWFSIANFIYFAGSVTVLATYPWFADHDYLSIANEILATGNQILYVIWFAITAIGFILCKKN